MSNHISPSENKVLTLNFENGIKVLVPCRGWKVSHIKEIILKEINEFLEKNKEIVETRKYDDEYAHPCGLVWNLESRLYYDYDIVMIIIGPSDIIKSEDTIMINYPYDLGEQETINDIQRLYPNYKYPYCHEKGEKSNEKKIN